MMTGIPTETDRDMKYYRFYDQDPLLFKWFNRDGFVTGFYEDYRPWGIFSFARKGFHYKPTDHYYCPLYVVMDNIENEPRADYCYMDKGMHKWAGDWTKSLVQKYAKLNSKYFQLTWTSMISHDRQSMLGQGDKYFYQLFKELDKTNVLNNTIVLFFSDHGYRYGNMRATKIGMNEVSSPMMNWIIPQWFQDKYSGEMINFRKNAENRLTTPFDIHRTLLEFTSGGVESAHAAGMTGYGKSLFDAITSKRTCASAGVPDLFCACRTPRDYPLNNTLTLRAADAVVHEINRITNTTQEGPCVKYMLRSIISSYINQRHDLADTDIIELSVKLAVTPSEAEFSSIVHILPSEIIVQGVERTNSYSDTADCVQDFWMKLYCTCLDSKMASFH